MSQPPPRPRLRPQPGPSGAKLSSVLACAVALTLPAVADSAVAAHPAPDLVVATVYAQSAALEPGSRFRVGYRVRNSGSARTGAFDVAYYLSRDARLSRGDRRLAVSRGIRRLGAHRASTGSSVVAIPASTPAESYRLLVCADPGRRVAEARERNNCRASRQAFWIATAPGLPALQDRPDELTSSRTARFAFSPGPARRRAAFLCRLDEGDFRVCSSPVSYSGLDDDEHTFAVKARDVDGRESGETSDEWTVDATAPSLPGLGARPNDPTNRTDASFSLVLPEPAAVLECSLDLAATRPCGTAVSFTDLSEGPHAFAVRARDRAGNIGDYAIYRWSVDLTPPAAPSLSARPDDPTNATTASFSFAGREPDARLECTLDWGPVTVCETAQSYAGLTEGAHVFGVRARDLANNESAFETHRWTVDLTAPASPSITSAPAAVTTSRAASFAFSSGDAGVTYTCALDGGGALACSSPKAYADLADGAHAFSVRARDAAGNDSAPARHEWRSDATPPSFTFTARPANPTRLTTARIEFLASERVSNVRCRLDADAFQACSSPVTYGGPLAEGPHTFAVTARDDVGHEGTSEYSWGIDLTPPSTPAFVAFPENPTGDGTATFRFSELEARLEFACRLDGAAFSACSNPQAYPGVADGSHRLEVKARDAAGNESGARLHRWLLDRTPPGASDIDLGVFVQDGRADTAAYQEWLGRPLTRVLDYVPGDSWSAIAAPDGVVREWQLTGYDVVYSTPMLPTTGASLEQGAAGQYDEHFRNFARTLVRYGQGDAVVRLGWEFNGNWFSWKAKGKTAEFIAFWRRIVTAMRGISPQLKFDWNPAYGPLDFDADQAYPGDAYVDYIGLVVFDQGWEPGYDNPILRWRNFINLPFAMQWHQDFAAQHGKLMTFPEFGLTFRDDFPGHGGGDNPSYVENMYRWLNGTNVAYAIYFEHDVPGSVRHSLRAGHFPSGAARFRELFGRN